MKKFLVITITVVAAVLLLSTFRGITRRQSQNNRPIHPGASQNGSINGQVLDDKGQPVSQAIVHAERNDFLNGILPGDITDERGKFVITGLPPGTYKVYGSKDKSGYPVPTSNFYTGGIVLIKRVDVYEGEATSDVTIYLGQKAAKLTGHVIDAKSKKLVKNTQIILRRVDNPNYFLLTGPDETGKFEILVPAVPFTVELSAPGYETQQLGPQAVIGKLKELTTSLREGNQ